MGEGSDFCHKLTHAVDLEVEVRHKCMLRCIWSISGEEWEWVKPL